MGYYIRRLLGMNHTFESREEVVKVAAAFMGSHGFLQCRDKL